MDNKTPLAIGTNAYAIKQSIINQIVKTIFKKLIAKFFKLVSKKIMLNLAHRNIP